MNKTHLLQWQAITHPVLTLHQTELWIRYTAAEHPDISGNKLLKLKYQLTQALQENYAGLLTFGGAFSNHLVATAAAAAQNNLKSTGIVRGLDVDLNNPTLALCRDYGMQLHRISREQYQQRHQDHFIQQLMLQYPDQLLIPEGGTCEAAALGISELDMLHTPTGPASLLVTATGSGGTLAGMIRGAPDTSVLGIAVVKDTSLTEKVRQLLPVGRSYPHWQLIQALHQPAYGRFDAKLWQFCLSFRDQQLQLEPVYTGKALYSVFELIRTGQIAKGSRISFFHTGGLQGLKGLAYRGLIPTVDSAQ